MNGTVLLGGAVGGLLGSGMLLVLSYLRARKYSLQARLEPYLVEPDRMGRFLGGERVTTPIGVWAKALEPIADRLDGVLISLSSPSEELAARLRRAGSKQSVQQFRVEQMQWMLVGLTAALIALVAISTRRDFQVLIAAVLVIGMPIAALILADRLLSRRCNMRKLQILAEFPAVAEVLALAVGSGEAPLAALERVSRSSAGALSEELAVTVASVRAGASVTKALEELGQRSEIEAISRFADGVAIAVDRGTPLAQVLKAQAKDARDLGHRELMELGGKKELMMLVPVVFLILPITVAFAVFPSLSVLNLGP